jgi:hypothetical protein
MDFDKVLAGIRTDFHQPGTRRRPRASQDALVAVLGQLDGRAFADMVHVDTAGTTKFHERLDDQIHGRKRRPISLGAPFEELRGGAGMGGEQGVETCPARNHPLMRISANGVSRRCRVLAVFIAGRASNDGRRCGVKRGASLDSVAQIFHDFTEFQKHQIC